MPEPAPVKSKAARPARQAASENQCRVVARYYRTMKCQRLYQLSVELKDTSSGSSANGAAAPLFIHPFIPGAHVTPAELTLDPANPGGQATFTVTPLARGKLRGARLDVFHQGRLIQEIPLAMKSTTQRMTWVLLLLTVLVPAVLLYTTVYYPMSAIVNEAPKKAVEAEQEAQKILAGEKEGPNEPRKGGGMALAVLDPTIQAVPRHVRPGEALEREIYKNVPDIPIELHDQEILGVEPFGPMMKHATWGVGRAYQWLYDMRVWYLPFWVGCGLLLLTLVSASAHRAVRKRKRGPVLSLASGAVQPPHTPGRP